LVAQSKTARHSSGTSPALYTAMMQPAEATDIEPRWPVMVAVVAVVALLTMLPARVRVFPQWVSYVLAIALIVPMAALAFATAKAPWLRIERIVTLLFFAIAGFAMVDQLVHLLGSMVGRSAGLSGLQLLTSSIAVWAMNVLIFSVAYWRTDRGGPEARVRRTSTKPDWLFPQEGVPDQVRPDWHPTFIDYLFLSYCTATSFSPTEAQPLTSRAMLLLMMESMISLVTVIAVAARAINILGS
jgi:hypothetical protein